MNKSNDFYSKYKNKYLELAIEYIMSQNKMKNQIIPETIILFILSFPVLIKLFTNGNIYGKCATDRSRLPGTGTWKGFLHLCQGFTFGISFRLSSTHPAFRILSYISGTVYPVYNLSKRLIKARKKFRESSFYLNLSDFIVGFIISIIGIEAFNLISNQLDNIIIDTNSIYYFLKLYTTLTIISLFFTFKRPEECSINNM